jgi:predicted transcriptional regulator
MKTLSDSNPIRAKKAPLSIRLAPEKKEKLEWLAQKKEQSVHFLLCRAVSEYIDNEMKRLAFYEDGRKALEHTKTTGLHTTHEEMLVWANSLSTENELSQPQCHR